MNIVELMNVAQDGDKVKCKIHGGQTEIATVRVTMGYKELILDEEWEDCIESSYHLYHLIEADYEIITPKYYLKHKWIKHCAENSGYLNKRIPDGNCYIYSKEDCTGYQTKFTLEEIEEIKKKYDTNLEDFKMVEVEE